MGDGWISGDGKSFFLAGDPSEDKDYYDGNISKLIKEIFKINIIPRNFSYWKVYGIGIYKQEIIKILLSFDLKKGKKVDTAYVPDWILKNKRFFFDFLRGLFDTDGSVFCERDYTKYASQHTSKYHARIRIRITSISSIMIDQIQNELNKLNFKCTRRALHRGFKNNRNNHDVYILEINNSKWINEFFKKVKPANLKHITKYLVWKKFGFCPPKTNINQRKEIIKNKLSPYIFYSGGA